MAYGRRRRRHLLIRKRNSCTDRVLRPTPRKSVLVPKSETVPKSGDTTFGRKAAMEKKSASDKAILPDENVHSSSTGELTGGNMRPNILYNCVRRQLPP